MLCSIALPSYPSTDAHPNAGEIREGVACCHLHTSLPPFHSSADAQPNAGEISEEGLLPRLKASAADRVDCTLVGERCCRNSMSGSCAAYLDKGVWNVSLGGSQSPCLRAHVLQRRSRGKCAPHPL